MSFSRSPGEGSSGRGSANYSIDMSLDENVPANIVVRGGKNLRENIDRTEEFLLPMDEKRVVMDSDKNDPTTAIFTFNRDGQTLGGILVSALLALPCVLFAAYRVPHPLFFVFELRLTTDGAMSPKEALIEASKNMVEDLVMLSRRFTHEWELQKQAKIAAGMDIDDPEIARGRPHYQPRDFSSPEEVVSRGEGSFQGRERSRHRYRYQSGAGSPGRAGYQVGARSPERVGYRTGGESPGWGGGARSPERSGFQEAWTPDQPTRSPDQMNQGGFNAESSTENTHRTGPPAVPERSINQGFWGDEKLDDETDNRTGGYQGYSSQGYGGSGYQFGAQQPTTIQGGNEWTPEYRPMGNQGLSYHDREGGGGYQAGAQPATTQGGNEWTPEYRPVGNQGSSYQDRETGGGYQAGGQQTSTVQPDGDWSPDYPLANSQGSDSQNRPLSPNRGYQEPRANDQAANPGYQGWDQRRQQQEDIDAPKDSEVDSNDW